MAQVIKLKRTAVQGKIPTTSNLDLGELAINTYDGRIFFEKDDGTPSIQEILTTDSDVTGSLNLNGALTASSLEIIGNANIAGNLVLGGNITIGDTATDSITVTADFSSSLIPDSGSTFDLGSITKPWNEVRAISFYGDGSGLTNLNVDVGETTTVTSSFENTSSISITHSFDSRNILVSVYDTNYSQIIPQEVTLTDNNTVDITLSSTHSGHVVVAKGGHIVSGSRIQIDEIASLDDTFTNQTSYTVNHTFETKNVFVIVYDSNDNQVIPQTVSTPTTSSVELGFENPTSGRVVIGKAGHIVSGSVSGGGTSDFTQLTNIPSGLVSSSNQILGGTGIISSSTQIDTNFFDIDGLVSSSQQVIDHLPSGVVSGSSQITFNDVSENPFVSSSNTISASGHFVPTAHESYDLGSATQRWRDLYLSGSTIDLGGTKISRDATSGDIEFRDGSNNRKSIKVDELTIGSGASARKIKVNNGRVQFTDESDNVESAETGHIIPSANNTYDLGSPTAQFRDLYLSSASLYIDGQQVISSDANTLTFTTDVGQSIKLLETGADDIILQTDTGNIELKGTVEILSGKKIVDSAATKILFGDSIGITGSIDLTGTVDGVDLSQLKTDFDTLEGKTLVSGSSQITTLLDGEDLTLNNLTVNGTQTILDSTRLAIGDNIVELNGGGATNGGLYVKDVTAPNTNTGSLLWDSTNDYWKAGTLGSEEEILLKNTHGVISGSSQVSYPSLSNIPSGIVSGSSQITITESQISDLTHYTDSDVKTKLDTEGVISGSSQVDYNSIQNQPTIPTNNNELTNGAGYITPTTTSNVTVGSVFSIKGSSPYVKWDNTAGTRLGYIQHNETDLVMSSDTGNIVFDPSSDVTISGIGTALTFDTTGAGGSNGIKTINDYESVLFNGRGSAGFAVIGNSNIRLGFGTSYNDAQSSVVIETNNNITTKGDIIPNTNGTQDLGSSTNRWNTLYTSDLSLSNGIGDYTIVEGEEDLFLYNNKSGKTFKFALIEVDPSVVPAKRD